MHAALGASVSDFPHPPHLLQMLAVWAEFGAREASALIQLRSSAGARRYVAVQFCAKTADLAAPCPMSGPYRRLSFPGPRRKEEEGRKRFVTMSTREEEGEEWQGRACYNGLKEEKEESKQGAWLTMIVGAKQNVAPAFLSRFWVACTSHADFP